MTLQDRYRGALVGLAVCDARGTTVEFRSPGSFKRKEPPDIKGTGYAVESLEAALWAFRKGKDFREGALLAVNLGDDADTTGAVYGQIAGASCYAPRRPRLLPVPFSTGFEITVCWPTFLPAR